MKRSNERRRLASAGLALVISTVVCQPVFADAASDLRALKETTRQLIDALANKGAISPEDAVILRRTVLKTDTAEPAVAPERSEADVENPEADTTVAQDSAGQGAVTAKEETPVAGPDEMPKVIRVPYVPDFVREEIRQQVRKDLRDEVVTDVMKRASLEGWGLPEALPAWTRRLSLSGDMRLRWESDRFASANLPNAYFNYQKINTSGGNAGIEQFLNVSKDRKRLRLRLRLGLDARIGDGLTGRVRLSSGNTQVPVSTNQTLGNTANRYSILIDQAFLRYDWQSHSQSWLRPQVALWGGRMPNPWVATDLVWDGDVNFEGLAGRVRLGRWGGAENAHRDGVFMTLGAFPLQEFERYADKWLYAGQLGTSWRTPSNTGVDFAVAYYDFRNIRGEVNPLGGGGINDYTAPDFIQKGNTLADLSGPDETAGRIYGLASNFKVVDAVIKVDLSGYAPVEFTADYAVNRGLSTDDALAIFGAARLQNFEDANASNTYRKRNKAYSFDVKIGSKNIRRRGEWQTDINWRHVERDAVLDAFTDSDFHLGGTDAEGWWLAGSVGIADNTWLTARWISADEIDGPPLGIDILFLDLNSRF